MVGAMLPTHNGPYRCKRWHRRAKANIRTHRAAEGLARGEVVVAEDHLIVVIPVVLGEQALAAQVVVRLQDQALPDLQREDALVSVRGDDAHAVVLSRTEGL